MNLARKEKSILKNSKLLFDSIENLREIGIPMNSIITSLFAYSFKDTESVMDNFSVSFSKIFQSETWDENLSYNHIFYKGVYMNYIEKYPEEDQFKDVKGD